ncbi:MAG: 3-keto-disaccharide hydrolase [Terriglobia bacterium]
MRQQRRWRWAPAAVSVIVLAFTATGYGAPPKAGRWTPLFNGHNLNGWRPFGTEKWVADHGTILGQSTDAKYGYLLTTKSYRDFDLRFKFECESDGNSGLFFHSRITGENPRWGPDIVGMQAEIDPRRHTGGLYESGGRGWVALPTKAGEKAIKPIGQWNRMEVYVKGDHIVTRLNGVPIASYDYKGGKYADGAIGLQLHMGEHGFSIRFKNIDLRPLP